MTLINEGGSYSASQARLVAEQQAAQEAARRQQAQQQAAENYRAERAAVNRVYGPAVIGPDNTKRKPTTAGPIVVRGPEVWSKTPPSNRLAPPANRPKPGPRPSPVAVKRDVFDIIIPGANAQTADYGVAGDAYSKGIALTNSPSYSETRKSNDGTWMGLNSVTGRWEKIGTYNAQTTYDINTGVRPTPTPWSTTRPSGVRYTPEVTRTSTPVEDTFTPRDERKVMNESMNSPVTYDDTSILHGTMKNYTTGDPMNVTLVGQGTRYRRVPALPDTYEPAILPGGKRFLAGDWNPESQTVDVPDYGLYYSYDQLAGMYGEAAATWVKNRNVRAGDTGRMDQIVNFTAADRAIENAINTSRAGFYVAQHVKPQNPMESKGVGALREQPHKTNWDKMVDAYTGMFPSTVLTEVFFPGKYVSRFPAGTDLGKPPQGAVINPNAWDRVFRPYVMPKDATAQQKADLDQWTGASKEFAMIMGFSGIGAGDTVGLARGFSWTKAIGGIETSAGTVGELTGKIPGVKFTGAVVNKAANKAGNLWNTADEILAGPLDEVKGAITTYQSKAQAEALRRDMFYQEVAAANKKAATKDADDIVMQALQEDAGLGFVAPKSSASTMKPVPMRTSRPITVERTPSRAAPKADNLADIEVFQALEERPNLGYENLHRTAYEDTVVTKASVQGEPTEERINALTDELMNMRDEFGTPIKVSKDAARAKATKLAQAELPRTYDIYGERITEYTGAVDEIMNSGRTKTLDAFTDMDISVKPASAAEAAAYEKATTPKKGIRKFLSDDEGSLMLDQRPRITRPTSTRSEISLPGDENYSVFSEIDDYKFAPFPRSMSWTPSAASGLGVAALSLTGVGTKGARSPAQIRAPNLDTFKLPRFDVGNKSGTDLWSDSTTKQGQRQNYVTGLVTGQGQRGGTKQGTDQITRTDPVVIPRMGRILAPTTGPRFKAEPRLKLPGFKLEDKPRKRGKGTRADPLNVAWSNKTEKWMDSFTSGKSKTARRKR